MTTYKGVNLEAIPTYDAVVYQSGLYTTAVDKNGNVLSSVLMTDKVDHTPINAAITYAATVSADSNATKGTVYIKQGNYHPTATITMIADVCVKCDGQSTYFHIETNTHDFCLMKPRCMWEGGYVYFYQAAINQFTYNGFVFYGGDIYSPFYGQQGIKNVVLNNQGLTTHGGKAIYLYCTNVINSGVYGLLIENIHIDGRWEYGIYFGEVGTNEFYETMSWNVFRNIWFYQNKYCLYMTTAGTYDVMDSNIFQNMYVQPRISAPYNVDGFTILGENNTFINCSCADWTVNEGYQWVFKANSRNNNMVGCWSEVITSHGVNDLGTTNKWIGSHGYVQENRGRTSVTLSSGSGTITHGLSVTPTWAICNATTNGDSVAITTLGATTLTVKVTTAAGGDGATQYINWMCGV